MPTATPLLPVDVCVAVEAAEGGLADETEALAGRLGLPLVDLHDPPAGFGAILVRTLYRLELRVLRGDKAVVGGRATASDLTAIDTTSGPGRSLGQPLLKAVGIKRRDAYRPRVLDATAGLGEDAWVLASAGCEVRAIERNRITNALLEDGLRRAAIDSPQIAGRLRLESADSTEVLQLIGQGPASDRPDVVYLDPMFPLGRKTAERKAMRVLRMVSGDDPDSGELLDAALQAAAKRVVVKRPRLAACLPGPEPSVFHKGKSLRFDVYLPGR
jgi:16S rRNA (guanine1516-N2)-methyltransferase